MKKQLVLFPKDSNLSAKDKERLSKNGFLAIELQYPQSVRMLSADGAEIGGDRMLLMALDAINNSTISSKDGIRERFTRLLMQEIQRGFANDRGVAK
jgi:hypothetical protein